MIRHPLLVRSTCGGDRIFPVIMMGLVAAAILGVPNGAVADEIPENAKPNIYGTGWTCVKGYRKSGNECLKVEVPANAKIDYTGSNWTCVKGYRKSGNGCLKVDVPANAKIDYTGSNWTCVKGYRKSGNECLKVEVPANAKIDYTGSNWVCNSGYKKQVDRCVVMTAQELLAQKEREQELRRLMEERKARGVSGDDCDTEYRTGAEVCVKITGGDINCNQSFSGDYYTDCDVTLQYTVSTDYSGGSYIEAEVECSVDIEYKGKNMYASSSDSAYDDEDHDLYAHDSDRDSMDFNFSFTYFNEVTSAKISSAECEIDDLTLY